MSKKNLTLATIGFVGGLLGIGALVWIMRRGKLPHAEASEELKYGDGTRDVVDQAAWESFPASDPPAY